MKSLEAMIMKSLKSYAQFSKFDGRQSTVDTSIRWKYGAEPLLSINNESYFYGVLQQDFVADEGHSWQNQRHDSLLAVHYSVELGVQVHKYISK